MTPEQIRAARSRAYAVFESGMATNRPQAYDVLALANEVEALQREIANLKALKK